MLELRDIAIVLSGVSVHETKNGSARFMRLSDLSDVKAGRRPALATGEAPAVARALSIEEGDLIVGARGTATDVCLANSAVFGAFVSLDLYLVRPDRAKVNPQYLAAFLDLPATQAFFAGGKQGSGLARLPKDALEKTRVPVPPMQSQILIAGLALSFEDETRLLKELTDLRSSLGRETIARAIGTADTRPKSIRSPR
jgi:Type I restriction modification DNA specificity domain